MGNEKFEWKQFLSLGTNFENKSWENE